jgi:hypothetical protein
MLRRRRGGAPTATIEEALSPLAPKNHRGGIVGLKPTAPIAQEDESVDATNFEDAESLTSSTSGRCPPQDAAKILFY